MRNMMIPSSVTIQAPNFLKVSGKKNPRTAERITQAAKVLPTKAETEVSAFTCLLRQEEMFRSLFAEELMSTHIQPVLLGGNRI